MKANEKAPTNIFDVARRAGVSRGTVDRVYTNADVYLKRRLPKYKKQLPNWDIPPIPMLRH